MKRILVADKDAATRQFLRAVLEASGFFVSTVSDRKSALRLLKKHKFDLVLSGIWAARVNGFPLANHLRGQPGAPRVALLIPSDTPEAAFKAVSEQVCDCLRKPVSLKDLVRLTERALPSKSGVPPIEVVSAQPDWVELLVPCDLDAAERIAGFLEHLETDLPGDVREQLGHAFRELLYNAIEWGGRFDASQKVRISFLRARRMVLYRIADPGRGFRFENLEHAALANPPDEPTKHLHVRAEKALRPGGFGLMMVRSMVDELIFNEAHNEVVFIKYLDSCR